MLTVTSCGVCACSEGDMKITCFNISPSPPSLPPLFHFAAVLHLLQHLDILQTHKGDIFEVNLPNKVTKIMAVPKKGTVREAIDPVMKKNNYSLEVMDLKFADTLKVYTRVCGGE